MSSARTVILILGASRMQLPAIQAAREKGWCVVVADRDSDAMGVPLCDRFEQVDLKDLDGMLEAARRCRSDIGLDGVFTAGTDFSTTVAWVAEHMGLPGIPYRIAQDASDKARMRAVFHRNGIPAPRFTVVRDRDSPGEAVKDLGFPLVVKPVDSMGARGVRRVDTIESLEEAVREAIGFSRASRAIVEEYVHGPEFSLDALIYRDEIALCGIADRHICFPPYFVEMGHTMPTDASAHDRAIVVDAFFRGIRALGLSVGAAKGDVKLSGGKPVIGEIAARLSGGYMSGWTYPYASGVRLTGAALNLAVGLPPGDLSPTRESVSAERAFLSIPGEVGGLEGIGDARETAGVRELFLRVSPGDPVAFPTNNMEKCGNVISECGTRAEAIGAAEAAAREVLVRLAPGVNVTQEFLFGRKEQWIPDAFSLDDTRNLRAVEEMPPYVPPATSGSSGTFPIGIVPIPSPQIEGSTDWHGRRLSSALSVVKKATGCSIGGPEAWLLGSPFWRALLRGGAQGGVWVVDTARRAVDRGGVDSLREMLESWA